MRLGGTARQGSMRAAALAVLLAVVWAVPANPGQAAPDASVTRSIQPATLPGPVAEWGTTTGTDGRTYFADQQGRALQFHGFNIKTTDPLADASNDLLAEAAERGLDHLRLSVFWNLLEPQEGQWDEAYLDAIVTVLDRAEAHGILVILDMHQDVFGEAFDSNGIPEWATRTDGLPFEPQETWLLNYLQPAVQAAWEHFYEDADLRQFQIRAWLKVVEKVKAHPAVFGYDLLNEPFGKIRDGETLFDAAERVEREQLTPMYQRLTDAISAVDPDRWVFIEPPNVASLGIATALGPVTGPKVALYPHMYDPSIEAATYQPGGSVDGYDPEFFTKWEAATVGYPARNRMPMLIGEWGIANPERPGMDEFVARSLEVLDRVGSGWSVFNWCRGGGYCPIDADGQDRPALGRIFQPYARAIAGAPTQSLWDPDAGVLRVRFADADGVDASAATDIFIPESRSYPQGWKVVTSDADGTWSQQFDPETGVLSVTTPRLGDGAPHAVCVQPADSTAECLAVDPEVPTTTTTSVPAGPPPAQPVDAAARFTG